MMRAIVFFLIAALALCAIYAAQRDPHPLQVDARSPGAWSFNEADYQECIRVAPPPIRAPKANVLNPKQNAEMT